jgi:hypothetical protein
MRVGWILNEKWLEETRTGLYSSMASYRHRAIIPSIELMRLGCEASVLGLVSGAESYDRGRRHLKGLDIVVFGKMFDATDQLQPLLRAAREAGVRTVVDICDDFFQNDRYGEVYRDVLAAADAVSTSSSFLATRIAEATGRRAMVIVDPYEGTRGTPRWQPRERLEAAWFGNVVNITGLDLALGGLLASRIPMHLVVMTQLSQGVLDWVRVRRPELAPAIDLDVRQWSLEATGRALQECDAVLLPIHRAASYYLSKGPDRMVEALWAGRFVTAEPLPAYEEFRDWAWIGENIAEGLAWAQANPATVTVRIAAAQAHIAERYSPSTVASAWGAYLTQLRDGRLPPGHLFSTGP